MATVTRKNLPRLVAPRRNGDDTVKALRRLHQRFAGQPPLTDAFLNRAKNEGRS